MATQSKSNDIFHVLSRGCDWLTTISAQYFSHVVFMRTLAPLKRRRSKPNGAYLYRSMRKAGFAAVLEKGTLRKHGTRACTEAAV